MRTQASTADEFYRGYVWSLLRARYFENLDPTFYADVIADELQCALFYKEKYNSMQDEVRIE